jgi:hypothetical protein
MVAGEEEAKHDGVENNNEGYESVEESVDDNHDGDYFPKGFESDDDDFDHLLNDDDIDEEDRRIEKMDSKSKIPSVVTVFAARG